MCPMQEASLGHFVHQSYDLNSQQVKLSSPYIRLICPSIFQSLELTSEIHCLKFYHIRRHYILTCEVIPIVG